MFFSEGSILSINLPKMDKNSIFLLHLAQGLNFFKIGENSAFMQFVKEPFENFEKFCGFRGALSYGQAMRPTIALNPH